jgi:hypothetical protein
LHPRFLLLTTALFILSSILFLCYCYSKYQLQRPAATSSPQNARLNDPTPLKSILVSNKLSVKITSPVKGQQVPVSNNVTIYGTSSDNATSDCQVLFILNDIKPYKKTIPTGRGSKTDDYSTWMYILGDNNSTSIKEGANKMTAKLTCFASKNNVLDPLRSVSSTKWYSLNITGIVSGHRSFFPFHSNIAIKNETARIALTDNFTTSYKSMLPTTVNGSQKTRCLA